MKQSIKDKILSETPEYIKQKVRDAANKLVMKEETLEQAKYKAYKEYWNENHTQEVKSNFLTAFKLGAKWQQETSYSEEEVLNIIQLFNDDFNMIQDTVPKWFKQFKKK